MLSTLHFLIENLVLTLVFSNLVCRIEVTKKLSKYLVMSNE